MRAPYLLNHQRFDWYRGCDIMIHKLAESPVLHSSFWDRGEGQLVALSWGWEASSFGCMIRVVVHYELNVNMLCCCNITKRVTYYVCSTHCPLLVPQAPQGQSQGQSQCLEGIQVAFLYIAHLKWVSSPLLAWVAWGWRASTRHCWSWSIDQSNVQMSSWICCRSLLWER